MEAYPYNKDNDIVSTSREILEKFIRELHELTTHVKILDIRSALGGRLKYSPVL